MLLVSHVAWLFSVLIALILSPSLVSNAAAQIQTNTTFGIGAGGGSGYNTAIGFNALTNNSGYSNTGIGAQALYFNSGGLNNTATGVNALFNNFNGHLNTAVGHSAMFSNTQGHSNTATGFNALFSTTAGTDNTASGVNALFHNTWGHANTASGVVALYNNISGGGNTAMGFLSLSSQTTGFHNTGIGFGALASNITGDYNTSIGYNTDVSVGHLTNATAIGAGAIVNSSNKIRLGNGSVSVIEGQVAFTAVSDKTQKENFQPVSGESVLEKIRGFELSSWNFIGHDPKQFRHYGLMAQDFFAAFGNDGVGQIGTDTTINQGDLAGILMIAVQALEKRTVELKEKVDELKSVRARLAVLESRQNQLIQLSAEASRQQ